MALSVAASGTQTATGSEDTLSTQTTSGIYVLVVDCSNMANGDVTELRLKVKTLAGSSSTLAYLAIYAHAQASPVKISVPVPATHQIVATLKQVAGTNRNYDWELMQIDA